MKPSILHRMCARPEIVSWMIGAIALESFVFAVPKNGVTLTSIASDWQGIASLLIGVSTVAGLGYFLGMFTCWPWVRPLCARLNGAPLKIDDRVLVLTGRHKGTTAQVYEITTGQGGWNLARLDFGPEHREKFTDIVEQYSVLKIGEHGAAGQPAISDSIS